MKYFVALLVFIALAVVVRAVVRRALERWLEKHIDIDAVGWVQNAYEHDADGQVIRDDE